MEKELFAFSKSVWCRHIPSNRTRKCYWCSNTQCFDTLLHGWRCRRHSNGSLLRYIRSAHHLIRWNCIWIVCAWYIKASVVVDFHQEKRFVHLHNIVHVHTECGTAEFEIEIERGKEIESPVIVSMKEKNRFCCKESDFCGFLKLCVCVSGCKQI